jgi:hypothetical protein
LTAPASPDLHAPAHTAADMIALARAYEPERYLAATLAKDPARTSLISLAAFSADLQRITTSARQPPHAGERRAYRCPTR